MKIIFLILCLTLVSESFGFGDSKCHSDPSNWCKNIETAKSCNVVEQCWKYVWSEKRVKANADLVNFTLYYETLCPDCRGFVSGQLWSAFQSVSSIMNLTLVPYGNAKETWRNETKLWQFNCQHGSNECWGNLLHSCLIYYYPNVEDHFPYIHCMESDDSDDIKKAATKCAAQFNITMDTLSKCMSSRLGNDLQHENAAKTEILNPPHQYVPWVTLNGVHTEDIEQRAEKDLIGLICNTYQGSDKPPACNKFISNRKCLNSN